MNPIKKRMNQLKSPNRVNIQRAFKEKHQPTAKLLSYWTQMVLENQQTVGQTTIRLVDKAESAALNVAYRQKQGPTNVLAFPLQDEEENYLGDLIICSPLVAEEAQAQGKSIEAHWAHLVVHGTLHLLGYDHIQPDEATIMENLEIDILNALNYPNPYEEENPHHE
jgi:probable rRNA maturation factor